MEKETTIVAKNVHGLEYSHETIHHRQAKWHKRKGYADQDHPICWITGTFLHF